MCRSRRWRWSFSAACIALWAAFALCLSASPANAGDAALTTALTMATGPDVLARLQAAAAYLAREPAR